MTRSSGLAVVCAVVIAGCLGRRATTPAIPDAVGAAAQVLVVEPCPGAPFNATLSAYERDGSGWRLVLGPLDAVVGRGGFAPPGEKREGDGRTPSGVFPLELAFGYAPGATTGLPYRATDAGDLWIDDPVHPDYNTWVRAPTTAASFERLRRDDGLYELGAVVGYNTHPVEAGKGSAIFLHEWRGSDRATAGCVALAKPDVERLLAWLDQAKRPVIVMGSR